MNKSVYRPFGAFRFFLALLVVCQHDLYSLPEDSRGFFYHIGLGVLAVAVFFTISGFIVAEANAAFYRGRPWQFMINRFLRLVPPYMAALAVAIGLNCWLYSIGQFEPWDGPLDGPPWRLSTMLSGFLDILPFFQPRYVSHQDFAYIPFAWTLRVEFAFYLFAFVTYWSLTHVPKHLKKWIGYAFFGLAYMIFFAFVLKKGGLPQQSLDIPFFMTGVCLYRLWRERTVFNVLHLVFAFICFLIAFPYWQQKDTPILADQYPILIALVLIFALLAVIPRISEKWKAIDKCLGDLSYPLYLNHVTVLFTISNLGKAYFGGGLYVVGIIASVILSAAMFWVVETPMRGMRDKVRGTAL